MKKEVDCHIIRFYFVLFCFVFIYFFNLLLGLVVWKENMSKKSEFVFFFCELFGLRRQRIQILCFKRDKDHDTKLNSISRRHMHFANVMTALGENQSVTIGQNSKE